MAEDYRFYRLIDSVRAMLGGKTALKPGVLFPSLAHLDGVVKDEDEDFDAVQRELRGFITQVAMTQQPTKGQTNMLEETT